ncbi:adenylate/guanylate cyclase domain-containing protein [Hoeflea sp. AS60]|uniref:CHASE2 domain-containing protein n=1 Tax=Hoeflea sp. AS60 TaxID=3135780 RepID=UPI00317C2EFA
MISVKPSSREDRSKRLVLWALGPFVVALFIAATVLMSALFGHFSNLSFDFYQRLKPRLEAGAPVLVIDIDGPSLREIGQWPWPRTTIATLVDRLGEMGAAAIAFDMVFPEPDRTSPARVIESLRSQGIDIAVGPGRYDGDNDAQLAEVFARNPVVAGIVISNENDTELSPPKAGLAFGGEDPTAYLQDFTGGVDNLPELAGAAAGIGFFSFPPGLDGIVRSLPLVTRKADAFYPALSVEALRVAQGAGSLVVRSTGASGEADFGRPAMTAIKVGAFEVPVGANGDLRIYYARLEKLRTIAAADLLEDGAVSRFRDAVAGHIVLIGTSAVGLRDLVATPVEASTPGVEVHAQIVDQIMGKTFLSRPDWARGAEIALAIGLAIILIVVEQRAGAVSSAAAAVALMTVAAAVSWSAFSNWQLLIDPVLPVVAVGVLFATTMPALLLLTSREKHQIRQAFGQYLSPSLVQRLADNPDELKLGGELRDLTVLFSDIRGFTSLSERMDADALTRLLNDFLTPTTDTLLRAEATIDKYIGDAVMAFWNAPLDIADHRRKACLAALAMLDVLAALNHEKNMELEVGIGLHSGECCVGNLGSAQRFSYSALGDNVNLASRIEGLTKQYKTAILVSEDTRSGADDLAFLEADRVRVVGRAKPVVLHVLAGDAQFARTPLFGQLHEAHARMLSAYRQVEIENARSWLAKARAVAPAQMEGFYSVYEHRLNEMQGMHPGAAWDGVYEAKYK